MSQDMSHIGYDSHEENNFYYREQGHRSLVGEERKYMHMCSYLDVYLCIIDYADN